MATRRRKTVFKAKKSFSERAERVADIILDRSGAGKKAKAKKIKAEVARLLSDLKQKCVGNIAERDLIHEAAHGAGKLYQSARNLY